MCVNPKEWVASTGVECITARRQCAAGTLPVLIDRIGQMSGLDRQVARVTVWATCRKLGVDGVVTGVPV
jgi:predicted site-specific integrase-resolvase